MLRRPEMRYWTAYPNNLTARQLATWMNEFGLTAEALAMYLDYFRFDMIENGKKDKITSKPINYFYGTVKNTGHYEIPENYLTLEQIRAKEEEEILKRKQEANKKLEETLRLSKIEDLRTRFLKIYAEPDSEEYKKLYNMLPKINFKNEEIIKSQMFTEYKKMHGILQEAKNP